MLHEIKVITNLKHIYKIENYSFEIEIELIVYLYTISFHPHEHQIDIKNHDYKTTNLTKKSTDNTKCLLDNEMVNIEHWLANFSLGGCNRMNTELEKGYLLICSFMAQFLFSFLGQSLNGLWPILAMPPIPLS